MSSTTTAAHRVFAITELFEQIMMQDCISLERLFIIQRISHHFRDIIGSSFPLTGKMRRRHLTVQEVAQQQLGSDVHAIISPFLSESRLQIQPYTQPKLRLVDRRKDNLEADKLLTIETTLWTDVAESFKQAGGMAGIKGRSRKHRNPGSWESMRLTMVPQAVQVRVHVKIGYPERSSMMYTTYDRTMDYASGKGTLGEFVRSLEGLAARAPRVHQAAAYSVQLSPKVFKPPTAGPWASQRTFTDPKLLERTLLHLDGHELFVIKRVNRAYNALITTSTTLRLSMGVGHPTSTTKLSATTAVYHPVCNPVRHLTLAPFSRILPDSLDAIETPKSADRLYFKLTANTNTQYTDRMGVQADWKTHTAEEGGSWTKIKIVKARLPLMVNVHVELSPASGAEMTYREVLVFEQPQHATFGNLLRFLEGIRNRSWKHHHELASRLSGTVRRNTFGAERNTNSLLDEAQWDDGLWGVLVMG